MLLATLGASPFIESFTLSGELLASLPAVVSLIAFVQYQRGGRMRWLVACGLLTGCAVLMKQSGFDGGLAAVAFLLLCRRRAGIVHAAVVVGCAVVPVAVAAVPAPSFDGWRPSPGLLRLWLGAAALRVAGGGNFHAHYYIQPAGPLAVLGGVGAARL